MKEYLAKEIKNVVLLGGSGSGKTTLAEAMAFEGNVINRIGSVEEETSLSDYTDIEHQYKRSIYSTSLFSEFNGYKLNIIDTPGSDDFCGSLFSAFKIADVGVVILNAQEGFETGTEIQTRHARKNNKPLIFLINQLDTAKADWEMTYQSIESLSSVKPVIVQYPINQGENFDTFIDVLLMKCFKFTDSVGTRMEIPIPENELEQAQMYNKELIEAAAENDENLMELYFEKGTLTEDEMREGLKVGLSNRSLAPVFCGAGKKDIGVKRLMEFITRVAPGPVKAPKFVTTNGTEIPADANGPTVLFVYKTAIEPHLGEVSYFRVVSGKVSEGQELVNVSFGSNKEKISQLFLAAGKVRTKVSSLSAGDLGCTVKLKTVKYNQTLATAGFDMEISPVEFPKHRFQTAIAAKTTAEDEKLGEALHKIQLEDPSISAKYSKELKQIIVFGQGEHHINIMKWTLLNKFKLDVDLFAPKIPYRETITKVATASYRHKKQSGGSGQFGEVSIVIDQFIEDAPEMSKFKVDGKEITLNVRGREEHELEWGGKLIFYNCIVGGVIDTRFMPAVVKGLMEKIENGPLTGSYARDIRVALYDGRMHAVDSNEISFKLAARHAFKEAFRTAGPKIMEPVYAVEILVPTDKMGDVMSDLQNRRALVEGFSSEMGFEVLKVKVPLAEMYRYSTTLSSLTSGRATFSMEFDSYQQVPSDVQDKLLKAYVDDDKED